MGVTAVVTDSTAYLPEGLDPRLDVTVVPLHVVLNGRSGVEGTEVTPAQVAAALAERRPQVTTSRPTPLDFLTTYTRLLDAGASGIVSVHISSELSGTWDAARLAAVQCNTERGFVAVRVVDSRTAAMGLGFVVLAAAEAVVDGADLDTAYETATRTVDRTTTLFCVDTLEHLRRGGRIGAAQALLGTALSMKPILHVEAGRIVPLEKVRTTARATARLVDLAVAAAGEDEVDVAVQHLAVPERAEQLAAALRDRLPRVNRLVSSELGAVIGAHAGPGVLGVVVVRR